MWWVSNSYIMKSTYVNYKWRKQTGWVAQLVEQPASIPGCQVPTPPLDICWGETPTPNHPPNIYTANGEAKTSTINNENKYTSITSSSRRHFSQMIEMAKKIMGHLWRSEVHFRGWVNFTWRQLAFPYLKMLHNTTDMFTIIYYYVIICNQ